jgi:hypothetical protein
MKDLKLTFSNFRGDPEKSDNYGNTALHLGSAKGHLNCVTFLINFGVNIWDLDIDLHSAKDLAAINNREDILKYLDAAGAQQDPKLAKSGQEKAKKEAEKRVKNFQKIQKKAEKTATKENDKIEKRRQSLHPQSMMENVSTDRRGSLGLAAFSSLTGTVASRKMKGGVFNKIQKKNLQDRDDNFTVREGGGTVRNLSGLRSGQVSEILFMDKESKNI